MLFGDNLSSSTKELTQPPILILTETLSETLPSFGFSPLGSKMRRLDWVISKVPASFRILESWDLPKVLPQEAQGS